TTDPAQQSPPTQPGAEAPVDDGSGRRRLGYIVGGLGLASAAVGAVFGLQALSNSGDARSLCDPSKPCHDPAAVQKNNTAKTDANIANIWVGVGIVAIGVSVYLVLSSGGS